MDHSLPSNHRMLRTLWVDRLTQNRARTRQDIIPSTTSLWHELYTEENIKWDGRNSDAIGVCTTCFEGNTEEV
jgi:hypothetical protein